MAFNWTCPHCNTTQTVTKERFHKTTSFLGLQHQSDGKLALESTSIGCANPECERTSLRARIGETWYENGSWKISILDSDESIRFSQMLIPQGSAKPQPEYVPQPLREDYYEACLIRDLSPKASATLTRRCLQGMIRDFAKIAKGTLNKEIEALKATVADGSADRAISIESVEAIDHVRGIGNIGAHMEKDINLIIEVDAGEAQALIGLVELLFEEWYGSRHRRQARLQEIESIAGAKKQAKAGGEPLAIEPTEAPAQNSLLAVPEAAKDGAATVEMPADNKDVG